MNSMGDHLKVSAPKVIPPGTKRASLLFLVASLFVLDGCQLVKGIFEAGVGVGVVVVVAVVAIIGGIAVAMSRR